MGKEKGDVEAVEEVVSAAENKGLALFFLSLQSPTGWLLHQKLEWQTSPLKTWAIVTMLCMAALDTMPYNR